VGDRLGLPCSVRVPTQKDIISVTRVGLRYSGSGETLDGDTTEIGSVGGETHPW
jgi:hypothetical protein